VGRRLADALAMLASEYPALQPLWPHLAVAVSGKLARPDTPLTEGVELALLPPVSGG
jgi:molybdopterin synthase catalytic subunit